MLLSVFERKLVLRWQKASKSSSVIADSGARITASMHLRSSSGSSSNSFGSSSFSSGGGSSNSRSRRGGGSSSSSSSSSRYANVVVHGLRAALVQN